MTTSFKTGLKPFVPDERDALFATFRIAEKMPKVPAHFGHADLLPTDIGMDGNDQYGCCAEAETAHQFMILNAIAGRPIPAFSTKSVLKFYSEVTGFDPTKPDTDQGTDYRQMLAYLRKTGIADDTGKRHKIGAFMLLKDLDELDEALYLFGNVPIGVDLPDSAQTQFGEGKPWTVVKNSKIDGGHAIGGIEKVSAEQYLFTTWGAKQPVSKAFVKKYMTQAWAVVSPEQVNGTAPTPEGFNMTQLTDYVSQF